MYMLICKIFEVKLMKFSLKEKLVGAGHEIRE